MTLPRKPNFGDRLAIVWFVCAVLLSAATPAMADWRPFSGLLAWAGWGVIGLTVMAILLIRRDWRAAGLLAVLLALAIFLIVPATILGQKAWDRLTFERARPAYAEIILRQASLPDEGLLDGVAYRIDRRPPARIAFLLPVHEFDDNWSAIVYDPSDAVFTPRDSDGRPVVKPQAVKLWGGDLMVCDHIAEHYFRCGFVWREASPQWPKRWRPRGQSAP